MTWRRWRPVALVWLVFLVVFGLLHTAVELAGPGVRDRAEAWTARATATTLNLLGANAHVDGTTVRSAALDLEIIRECTAIHPLIVLVSAIVAFRARWSAKLLGLAVGVPALLAINLVRLVSLFWIGLLFPRAVDTVHLLFWQPAILFATAAIWIVWASTLRRAPAIRPA